MKIKALLFDLSNISAGRISQETHTEHIGLYNGYVKNVNLILEKLDEYSKNLDLYTYEFGELSRRFSFEYNGIKNHEYYFSQLLEGSQAISTESRLYKMIIDQWGSWDSWMNQFIVLAKTRGIGWAVLYHDRERDVLFNVWVDEQHLGHLNSCNFIYGIDMWEHSYVHDYLPSGKSQYISDYIEHTNWQTVSNRLTSQ